MSGRGWEALPPLDLAALKRAVRLEQVLEHYGIQGLRRSGRDQYRGRCPIHQGQGREAFHVNLARDIFHCFSCGAGGTVLDFVAAMEGCRLRQAAAKLRDWFGVPPMAAQAGRVAVAAKPSLVTEKRNLSPLRFVLRSVDPSHPYLQSRGITAVTAAEFGVGFYGGPGLLRQRLVIPIHDERGQLVAYCGRSLQGAEPPRYRFPPGFAKSRVLFNFHRAAAAGESRVIVVEGFFDCLKLHQAGFPSVVALMGTALYQHPERLLRERFRQVVLLLDGDQAGRRASMAIAARLASGCSVRVIELAPDTQPDQLATGSIRQLLAADAQ